MLIPLSEQEPPPVGVCVREEEERVKDLQRGRGGCVVYIPP